MRRVLSTAPPGVRLGHVVLRSEACALHDLRAPLLCALLPGEAGSVEPIDRGKRRL